MVLETRLLNGFLNIFLDVVHYYWRSTLTIVTVPHDITRVVIDKDKIQ